MLYKKNKIVCSVVSCDRLVDSRGLCIFHYKRWWRGDKSIKISKSHIIPTIICLICKNKEKYYAKDVCKKCYLNKWGKSRVRDLNLEIKKKLAEVAGLSIEDFIKLSSLENLCAICGEKENSKGTNGRVLHYDHDHETGKFRGFLCRGCNLGLGNFKDNVIIIERALIYLKKHKVNESIKERI